MPTRSTITKDVCREESRATSILYWPGLPGLPGLQESHPVKTSAKSTMAAPAINCLITWFFINSGFRMKRSVLTANRVINPPCGSMLNFRQGGGQTHELGEDLIHRQCGKSLQVSQDNHPGARRLPDFLDGLAPKNQTRQTYRRGQMTYPRVMANER